jgi:hypothetical protein
VDDFEEAFERLGANFSQAPDADTERNYLSGGELSVRLMWLVWSMRALRECVLSVCVLSVNLWESGSMKSLGMLSLELISQSQLTHAPTHIPSISLFGEFYSCSQRTSQWEV